MKSNLLLTCVLILTVGRLGASTEIFTPVVLDSSGLDSHPYNRTGFIDASAKRVHGSGAVVKHNNVVISCAHVPYDDGATDPWTSDNFWHYKWHSGEFPSREGQALRGYWFFERYSSEVRGGGINSPGAFSYDFVAYYAYEKLGDSAGYWPDGIAVLKSDRWKLVTGYPSGLHPAGHADEFKMHFIGPFNYRFDEWLNRYLGIDDGVSTAGGNSGGPVWVWDGSDYYFAGVAVSSEARSEGGAEDSLGIVGMDTNSWDLVDSAIDSSSEGGSGGNSLPDLTVSQFQASPGTVEEGQLVTLTMTINNADDAPAGPSQARMFLSPKDDFDTSDDTPFGSVVDVPALSAGEQYEAVWSGNMPNLGSGTYNYWTVVEVDVDNDVEESDEANLWSPFVGFTAKDPESGNPDLRVTSISVDPLEVEEGQSIVVNATVDNAGNAAAPATRARVYLSTDSDFDTADDYQGELSDVSPLGVGEEQSIIWILSMPNLGSGTYNCWVLIQVDVENSAAESDERNTYKREEFFTVNDTSGLAPQILAQPQSITRPEGQTATFSAEVTGDPAPSLRWQRSVDGGSTWNDLSDGGEINGSSTTTLTVANVTTAMDGHRFRIRASNSAGTTFSLAASLSVTTVNVPSFVQRDLPSGYTPGTPLTVRLQAEPPAGTASYTVSDQPPTGWTVGSISHSGAFDSVNHQVKFGPYFDDTARTLSYVVTPPSGESGVKTFTGNGSADGSNSPVGGESEIDQATFHPADNNPSDMHISDSEVTGYGAAWKRGDLWPIDPNPIPDAFVTRAGFLWRRGESYQVDAATPSAPLWWVPAATQQGILRAAVALHPVSTPTDSTAVSEMPPTYTPGQTFTVTITTTPVSGIFAQTVSDQPPGGWTVTSIDNNGSFDSVTGRVKWGPFFDDTARTLSYQITPPSGTSGTFNFTGNYSVDGHDIPITGQRQTTLDAGAGSGAQIGIAMFAGITVEGEAGSVYQLEFTEDVESDQWSVLTNITLNSSSYLFIDTGSTNASRRFYRAKLVE